MTEKQLQQEILKIIGSHPDYRLFRNNVGNLYNIYGQRVNYGLCKGSGDLIGIKKVTIAQDMVGSEIGQFVSIEVKSEKGKLSTDQLAWLNMVQRFGGVGLVVDCIEQIKERLLLS